MATSAGSLQSFTTPDGWLIELSEARALFGPLYLYSGGQRASLLRSLFSIGVAHAHPSDDTFDRGQVLGNVIDQRVVDILSGSPTSLGLGPGLLGTVTTVELQLHPPGFSDPAAAASETAIMHNRSFVFRGVASRDDVSIPFYAAGDLGTTLPERTIESIEASVPLDEGEDGSPSGALLLTLHLDEWFRLINFEALTEDSEPDDDGAWDLMADSRASEALRRGIRSRFAYTLSWDVQGAAP